MEFRGPAWIPCSVSCAPLTWHVHGAALEALARRHPRLFPDFQPGRVRGGFGPAYRAGEHFRDNWGCIWYTAIGGLEGQVVGHPLADWSALRTYRPPDPRRLGERGPRDWAALGRAVAACRRRGQLAWGDGERLFDRLYFLRGFENLMRDIARDDPHLPRLLEMLLDYETRLVRLWLALGVDVIGFHTDIGTQQALMISPAKFRRYVKPLFAELFGLCRRAGVHVALSSDGHVLPIVDDLIECGVSVHDPQLRANGLDGIARAYKGRLCANVDLDRQMFAFCTPADIQRQVREVVTRLADPRGGLMVSGSVWDGLTPLENIAALCAALEEHCLGAGP